MDQKNTWIIKICCVIAAFSLWLYIINETNPQKTDKIQVPVYLTGIESIEQQQKLKIIPPAEAYSVILNVKGSPTDIMLGKDQFRVEADLSQYAFSVGSRSVPVRLVKQPANVNVLNSETLFVSVTFDDLIVKSMPVKLDIAGKVKDGYWAMAQNITPSEVEISGAAKFINQVTSISAKADFKSTDKDLNMKLPLKALDAAGREIKEVTIHPDTVEFIVPVKKIKTVPVTVDTKGTLNKLYSMKGALLPTPDKIDIAGDEASINAVNALKTEPIDLSALTPDKVVIAKIIVPQGVSLLNSDGTVKVKASLDNVINKTFQGTIQLKNVNDAYTVALDSTKVSVELSGPQELISNIKNEDFNYTIDAASFTEEKDYTVAVNLKIPDGVSKLSQNPQSVKITVKKKETQPTTTTPTQPSTTQTNTQ